MTATKSKTHEQNLKPTERNGGMESDTPNAADSEAGRPELSPVQSIPLELVDPPANNPRESFPEEELRSLADWIAAVGLLQAVIVRPTGERFELVAGERRKRAVALLDWDDIPATVRILDDREAAEVRLIENFDRKSLTPFEEVKGFCVLQELGHDAASIAALLRLPAAAVENRLRFQELPEFWRDWLRADDPRRGAAAELLVEWIDFPQVLDVMQRVVENGRWPMSLVAWRRELTEGVLRLSRDCDPQSPCGPLFEIAADDDKSRDRLRERLQVVELQ